MNHHALLDVAVCLTAVLSLLCTHACTRSGSDSAATRPLIVAHRGLASEAPENSGSAIERAFGLGADGVEVDLQATAGGEVVVFHDEDLERLTGRSGKVWALSREELEKTAYRDSTETILSLEALLDRFGGRGLLFLEMKAPAGPHAGRLRRALVERVAAAITERRLEDSTLVSSLDRELVGSLAASCPGVRTVFEFFPPPPEPLPATAWLGPQYRWVTANRIRSARRRFAGVSTFTPNTLEDFVHLADCGVDLIQTDVPRLALLWRAGKLDAARRRPTTREVPDAVRALAAGPGQILTFSVPAAAGEIQFVEVGITVTGGTDRVAFLVVEEPEPEPSPPALRPGPEVLARVRDPHVAHLRTVAAARTVRTTILIGTSTRSLFIGLGLEGGSPGSRLAIDSLEVGVLEP